MIQGKSLICMPVRELKSYCSFLDTCSSDGLDSLFEELDYG